PRKHLLFPSMHTIIHPTTHASRHRSAVRTSAVSFRKPMYQVQGQADCMKLVIFVPGVDAAGVSIAPQGAALRIIAPKTHFVRVNWQSLHLEGSQRDYRLSLRLGRGLNFEAMQAEIHNGVLTVTLPRLHSGLAAAKGRRAA